MSYVVAAVKNSQLDLNSPDSTLALLQLNAVIGVTGFFDSNKNLTSIGIQCAVCHSTVDDSFAPGIGHRLDGWANRDLDVGAIINLAPDLSVPATVLGVPEATVRSVLKSWVRASSTRSSSWTARLSAPTIRLRPH